MRRELPDTEAGDEPAAPGAKSISEIVCEVLARAPEWLRHDLAVKDTGARSRAEETLAAMISAALAENKAAGAIAA